MANYVKGLPLKFVKYPLTTMGRVNFGESGASYDVYFYGDTAGSYMHWDASANKLNFVGTAQIDIGASEDGVDVLFYGDTSGSYVQWDASDNRLEFVGGASMSIGSSSTRTTLTTSTKAVDIYTTSTSITGAVKSVLIDHTYTGAVATAHNIEVMKVQFSSNVKTGAWVNAIFGRTNYDSAGWAYGSASAICGELSMPPGATTGQGTYSVFQAELDCPASWTGNVAEISIFDINVWGDTAAQFDTQGHLFALSGLTAAAGKILSADSLTMKVRLDTTTKYLVFSEMENGLSLGLTGSRNTLAVDTRALDIYTTSTSITGAVKSVLIDHTYTGAVATAHNIEVLKAQFSSNVKTGAWVNAIFGRTNYDAAGWAYGSASAICGELSLPPGATTGQGTYSVFQAELDAPDGWTGNVAEVSIFDINVWGDASGNFDDQGFLFTITGVASGSAHFWYDHQGTAPTNVEEWIKVKTPGGVRYLALYNAVV